MKTISLQAEGEFPFTFYIEKAVPINDEGKLIVEGVASTVNVDHDNERMAGQALESMANVINAESVPLRLEHSKDNDAVIGSVYKAWVDDRNQLWIRAAIDPGHPAGPMLHESLKQGAKFGLSVGGKVMNAVRELVESTGKYVKTFYDVALDEVSVTRKPANYDAWLFAKSIKSKEADVGPYYDSPLYKQFLFENQGLDYIQQFAKSIPDSSWKKVDNNNISNNKSMEKDKITKKLIVKSEEDDKKVEAEKEGKDDKAPMPADTEKDGEGEKEEGKEAEKSFVSKSEFVKAMDMIKKGFDAIGKALEVDPMTQTNPDKNKEQVEEQQVAKEGDENGSDENGEREEKESEGDKKTEDTEKDAEDDKDDGEYKIKSMSDSIARISRISKGSKGEKVTKSANKFASIDEFAVTVAEALDSLNERFEKSGIRVPGITQNFINMLQNDPALQEEVRKMMKEPGMKKSVVMGVPYMITREGKKYSLSASPVGDEIKKSEKPKDFKEAWKSSFSSEQSEAGTQ